MRVLRLFLGAGLILVGFAVQVQAQEITGGCTATINGRAPASLTKKDPLLVRKDESVSLSGQVPASVAPAGSSIRSTTDVYVSVLGVPVKIRTATGKGPGWGGNAELPEFVRNLAVGVYKVSGKATGSPDGWSCSGSGYIELDGNPLTKPAVYAGAGFAAAGAALVARGRRPKRQQNPGTILVDLIKDLRKEFQADAFALAFFLIVILLMGMSSLITLAGAAVVPRPESGTSNWVRGRPVGGFFGGLLFSIGLAIVLQQFGLTALDTNMGVAVLSGAVVFAIRAWMGTPYKSDPGASVAAPVPSEPDDSAPPTHEPEPVS